MGHKKGGRESIPNAPLTRVLPLGLARKVLHHICSFEAGEGEGGVLRSRKQTEGEGG